jgi:hypothetical protein
VVPADTRLAPGDLAGLSPSGSIWLVAITDPQGEVRAFTPLGSGSVTEVERLTVYDHGASGLVLRLRPAT